VKMDETGTERILLVDDEEAIVRLETLMLERLGYIVTARTSSIEALAAFKVNPAQFDLVLTDMTMPNMTGTQLARELISIRPDIPVIICTGFSEKISEDNAAAMGIKGFLMKPVVKSEIAKVVRRVLDAVTR
jgi:CheY-like chemotaxis protein